MGPAAWCMVRGARPAERRRQRTGLLRGAADPLPRARIDQTPLSAHKHGGSRWFLDVLSPSLKSGDGGLWGLWWTPRAPVGREMARPPPGRRRPSRAVTGVAEVSLQRCGCELCCLLPSSKLLRRAEAGWGTRGTGLCGSRLAKPRRHRGAVSLRGRWRGVSTSTPILPRANPADLTDSKEPGIEGAQLLRGCPGWGDTALRGRGGVRGQNAGRARGCPSLAPSPHQGAR